MGLNHDRNGRDNSQSRNPNSTGYGNAVANRTARNTPSQAKVNPYPVQKAAKPEEELQMKQGPLQQKNMEEDELKMKQVPDQPKGDEEKVQLKKVGRSGAGKMPAEVQAKMENSFGTDFSDVNIHANSDSATQMGALAYAQGTDVHFAPGKYNPNSQKGQELLGHELTHVVQQKQGRVQATTQAKGVAVNDDKGLEKEADVMGAKAAKGEFVQPKLASTNNLIQKQEDGSGKYGSEEAGFSDHAKKHMWFNVAHGAEAMGYVNAARHMRHYLNNSGSNLQVDADSMIRDLPVLKQKFENEIRWAKQYAEQMASSGNRSFQISGGKKNHYATKSQSGDWFFAIGGFTYWVTADVTVTPTSNNGLAINMKIKLHVFDRYNWDKGKSVTIAGITVSDESLGKLHKVGLAREYEVHGSSSINDISWTFNPEIENAKVESFDIKEGRGDRRSDPTRPRASR